MAAPQWVHPPENLAETYPSHGVSPGRCGDIRVAQRTPRVAHRSTTWNHQPVISVIEDDVLLRALLVEWLTRTAIAWSSPTTCMQECRVPALRPRPLGQAKTRLLIVDVFMPRAHGTREPCAVARQSAPRRADHRDLRAIQSGYRRCRCGGRGVECRPCGS